jgi:hypothetical protein
VAVTSANSLSTKHVKDAELSSGVGTRAVEAESYDRMRPSRTLWPEALGESEAEGEGGQARGGGGWVGAWPQKTDAYLGSVCKLSPPGEIKGSSLAAVAMRGRAG